MKNVNGKIRHESGRVDELFRVTLKALIINDKGEILVVKESGRDWWDFPGGGMEHEESVKESFARELYEEVGMRGDFTFEALHVSDPHLLGTIDVMQIRIVFIVKPIEMTFSVGQDSDEIAFIEPGYFEKSNDEYDQEIYRYWSMAKAKGIVGC